MFYKSWFSRNYSHELWQVFRSIFCTADGKLPTNKNFGLRFVSTHIRQASSCLQLSFSDSIDLIDIIILRFSILSQLINYYANMLTPTDIVHFDLISILGLSIANQMSKLVYLGSAYNEKGIIAKSPYKQHAYVTVFYSTLRWLLCNRTGVCIKTELFVFRLTKTLSSLKPLVLIRT